MITNRVNLRLAAFICIVASTFMMVGCTTSELSLAFTAFADAISVGSVTSTVLCGAGTIPAPVCNILLPALSNAANVAPQVQAELNSTDPLAVQIAKCVALLTPLVGQSVPGLSVEAQAILSAVGEAAKALITELQSLLPAAAKLDANAKVGTSAHVPMTAGDRKAISDGVALAHAAKARIVAYQSAHK